MFCSLARVFLIIHKKLAFGTFGPWAEETKKFFDAIGTISIKEFEDVPAKEHLHQRISIAIQSGNAASVLGALPCHWKKFIIYSFAKLFI